MQAGDNKNGIIKVAIEQQVRKPLKNRPTSVSLVYRAIFWEGLYPDNCRVQRVKKLIAQSGPLPFVPIEGCFYIVLGVGAKQNRLHELGLRSLCWISSQLLPPVSPASTSSSRRSSSASCSEESPRAEDESCRLSQSWSNRDSRSSTDIVEILICCVLMHPVLHAPLQKCNLESFICHTLEVRRATMNLPPRQLVVGMCLVLILFVLMPLPMPNPNPPIPQVRS